MIMINGINFEDILASTAHDMKNSLGMLLNTLDEVTDNCLHQNCSSSVLFPQLQYEVKRVNNDLIQLLTLYKMGNAQFFINISHQMLYDFIEENILYNKALLDAKGVEVELECPEDLFFFFDRDLISGVLNNVLNNAFRYAGDRLRISAQKEDDYLAIRIEDNGKGFPEHMLSSAPGEKKEVSFRTGSTGLGLYFASIVAGSHKNRGREGFVTTTNGGKYHGGCFTIYLP